MGSQSIFSADALRARRAKPLKLPTYFLRLPSALMIVLIFASTLSGLIWCIFAKIPVKVPGKAVVVNVNDIKPMRTKSSGRIIIIPPSIAATRKNLDQQIYNFYNSSDFNVEVPELVETVRNVLTDTSPAQFVNYSKLTTNTRLLSNISMSKFDVKRGQVVTIVFNEESRSGLSNMLLSSVKRFDTNKLEIQRAETNLKLLKKQSISQGRLVQAYTNLKSIGAASEVQLIQVVQELNSLKQQISQTKNNIDQLIIKNKSISDDLQGKLVEYIANIYVFSEASGYVSSISKGNEQYSDINQPVLYFSAQPSSTLPSWIVGFTDDRSANQITDGMKVVATPQGINKSQYGGIRGVVTTKLPFTMTSQRLADIVGIESLAQLSNSTTANPNLLVIRMSMDAEGDSYKWTTKQTPPVNTGIGDVLNLDIDVREQSPLMMAIPIVKRYLGLEGPTTFSAER